MRWNVELQSRDPRAFDATVSAMARLLPTENIQQIAFGGVFLRRRDGASSHWVRALHMSEGRAANAASTSFDCSTPPTFS
jgi:hypothetical protein